MTCNEARSSVQAPPKERAETSPTLLFVVSTLEMGGSESKVVRLANALARTGSPVKIAYLGPPDTLRSRIDPEVPVVHLQRRGKYSLGALRRLHKLMAAGRHVVVAVNLYPLLYVASAKMMLAPGRASVACLLNMVEMVVSRSWHRQLYARLLRRCDLLVFAYESQRQAWNDAYGLAPQAAVCIHNGVNDRHFFPGAEAQAGRELRNVSAIPDGALVVGSVGRLAPEKHFELLIGSIADLHSAGGDCYLALAGDGPERARLEALAAEHGLSDRIRFLGALQDVRPALAMMDVFVLPSRTEAFSNAALEAMAMGRPVVLSETGGACEMIKGGESGRVFPVGDRRALAEILHELLASPTERTRMGDAARERVLECFRFDQMVERYRSLAEGADLS